MRCQCGVHSSQHVVGRLRQIYSRGRSFHWVVSDGVPRLAARGQAVFLVFRKTVSASAHCPRTERGVHAAGAWTGMEASDLPGASPPCERLCGVNAALRAGDRSASEHQAAGAAGPSNPRPSGSGFVFPPKIKRGVTARNITSGARKPTPSRGTGTSRRSIAWPASAAKTC